MSTPFHVPGTPAPSDEEQAAIVALGLAALARAGDLTAAVDALGEANEARPSLAVVKDVLTAPTQ